MCRRHVNQMRKISKNLKKVKFDCDDYYWNLNENKLNEENKISFNNSPVNNDIRINEKLNVNNELPQNVLNEIVRPYNLRSKNECRLPAYLAQNYIVNTTSKKKK